MLFNLERPLYMFLIIFLPLIYLFYIRSSRVSKKALIIRIFLLLFLIIALASPRIYLPTEGQNVLFLVDQSHSISAEMRTEIQQFIEAASRNREEGDRFGLISFGRSAILEKPLSSEFAFTSFSDNIDADYTNIEAALNLGQRVLGQDGKMILFSDGMENLGDYRQSLSDLEGTDITVDVLTQEDDIFSEVLVRDIFTPAEVTPEESFSVTVSIKSNIETTGILKFYINDQFVSEQIVAIENGQNIYSAQKKLTQAGLHNLQVVVEAEDDTILENNRGQGFVYVKGRQQVLFVGEKGEGYELLQQALQGKNLQLVGITASQFPAAMSGIEHFSAIVLNDVDADDLRERQLENLRSFVYRRGGGLLVFGGESSFGAGNYYNTALDNMLPVSSGLKQEVVFPNLTLMLVLDKSGSMAEEQPDTPGLTKMDLARQASVAALETLQEEEKIGVIAFDVGTEEVVPVQQARNRREIIEQISGISPGGGTNIYPALQKAYDILQADDSAVRHIILLSDGISEEGDFAGIMQKMNTEGISLTAVSVGEDVDLEFMEELARMGGGESYHATDIATIPRIFVTEVKRIPRQAVKTGNFQPQLISAVPYLDGQLLESIPVIDGYVATTPREMADDILITSDGFPLLAAWRYGLGRSAVFTSDLAGQWTQSWQEWPGFEHLWGELISRISRDFSSEKLTVSMYFDENQGKIEVDAVDLAGNYMNFLKIEADLGLPGGKIKELLLKQTGPGHYQASFTPDRPGVYMVIVRTEHAGRELEIMGGQVLSYSPEFRSQGSNPDLLVEIAGKTGGQIIETPEQIQENRVSSYSASRNLSFIFLVLAFLLFFVDIGIRTINKKSWQKWLKLFDFS